MAGDPRVLVFLLCTEGHAEDGEAVAAHLSDVAVELQIERPAAAPEDLLGRIRLATSLAHEKGAIGTFWLEEPAPGDLLLYLFEPEGARVLVRRVASGDRDSGIEEVAVITRETASALLEGSEIGMEPVAAPIVSAPAPTPARVAPRRTPPSEPVRPPDALLRLGLAYEGGTFARRSPWQNGISISLGVSPARALRVGAGYAYVLPIEARSDAVAVTIERHPIEAFASWETRAGPLAVAPEVAFVADRVSRSTRATGQGLEPTPSEARWVLGLSARLRAFSADGPLRPMAALGVDVFPRSPDYYARTGDLETVVATDDVRVRLDVGLALEAL